MLHPSPRCVVELRTERHDEKTGTVFRGIGSGYLVADGWVLTAAHVVVGAFGIRAWIDPPTDLASQPGFRVDLATSISLGGVDWALLRIAEYSRPAGFVPAAFGRLDRDSTEPVPVTALGLPWHRLRDAPADDRRSMRRSSGAGTRVRAVLATGGRIIPASGGKTGTVENIRGAMTMEVATSPESASQSSFDHGTTDPSTGADGETMRSRSVWEGMSGAAVWAGRHLIGVVVRHELLEGAAALTVDPLPDDPRPDAVSAVPALGSPEAVRSAAGEVLHTYRLIAEDRAPAVLTERGLELADLEGFAGTSTDRWWWWEGGAFAGKTALTSWWVAYRTNIDSGDRVPGSGGGPSGVGVVACFLSRARQQDTAEVLLRSWIRQLAAIAGRPDLGKYRPLGADPESFVQLQQLDRRRSPAVPTVGRALTLVLGHAESSRCCWGSEMIQNHGPQELFR